MNAKLKPISDQVMVITGASSGIGLATARKAAKAGAKVLLVARNADALRQACEEIRRAGGQADYAVADVGEEAEVATVVAKAGERFGGFDTWVNDAGVGVMGALTETPTAEHERLFKTNYWGTVFGSLAAVQYLKTRPGGGALINVGSVASDMPSPRFGAYVASKHAVKGFTDSLRIDLIADRAPISVTLIKPSGIGTPFAEHSANHLDGEARIPAPVYSADIVADAILHAARTPRREITVGSAGRQQVMLATHFPTLFDRLAPLMIPMLSDRKHAKTPGDNFDQPGADGATQGRLDKGRGFSLYTTAQLHPRTAFGLSVLAGAAAAAVITLRSTPKSDLRRLARQLPRPLRKWARV